MKRLVLLIKAQDQGLFKVDSTWIPNAGQTVLVPDGSHVKTAQDKGRPRLLQSNIYRVSSVSAGCAGPGRTFTTITLTETS